MQNKNRFDIRHYILQFHANNLTFVYFSEEKLQDMLGNLNKKVTQLDGLYGENL
jgi:hypothetical protein